MKFDNVCVEHFVEVTHTFRQGDKIGTRSVSKEDVPAYSAYAKAHKPEIMEYLLKKEKQAEEDAQKARERQAKIEAIEGLKELEMQFFRASLLLPLKALKPCGRNTPAPQHTARLKPVRLLPIMLRQAHTRRLWSASSMVMTTRRPLQMQTLNGKRILTSTSGTKCFPLDSCFLLR